MLVGDAERDAVAAMLRRHYVLGRLTSDELAARVETTLRARDRGELQEASRGLPPIWRDRSEQQRIARAVRRGLLRVVLLAGWLLASFVLLVGFVLGALLHGATSAAALAFAGIWLLMTVFTARAGRRT